MRSSIRADATPKASPGGSASAFCEPVSRKSTPHSSGLISAALKPETESTMMITSSNSCTTFASEPTSFSTLVEVSECATVTVP